MLFVCGEMSQGVNRVQVLFSGFLTLTHDIIDGSRHVKNYCVNKKNSRRCECLFSNLALFRSEFCSVVQHSDRYAIYVITNATNECAKNVTEKTLAFSFRKQVFQNVFFRSCKNLNLFNT